MNFHVPAVVPCCNFRNLQKGLADGIVHAIYLCRFSIDVSNNQLVNNYLIRHTGTGKKLLSSPEKDSEVVVMNPLHDYIISSDGYLSSVYILYALHIGH